MISHTETLNIDQIHSRIDDWPILESARVSNDGSGVTFDPYNLAKLLKNRKHKALVHIMGSWIRVKDLKNFLTIFKNDGMMKMTPTKTGIRMIADWDKVNVNFLCQKIVGETQEFHPKKNRWFAGVNAGLFAVNVPVSLSPASAALKGIDRRSRDARDAAKVTPETPTQPDPVVETVKPVKTPETPVTTPMTPTPKKKTRRQPRQPRQTKTRKWFVIPTTSKIFPSRLVARLDARLEKIENWLTV